MSHGSEKSIDDTNVHKEARRQSQRSLQEGKALL